MDVHAIDHVKIRVPADGLETAVDFYGGVLGFDIENRDLYEAGDKPFVSARLNDASVLHIEPTEGFTDPSLDNYDHLALVVDGSVETLADDLREQGVEVEMKGELLGATGEALGVYVRDPFGYRIELKETG